jgi:glyoxylase-like metal-dependent hydrolase (beta-lactamase superfamily II)
VNWEVSILEVGVIPNLPLNVYVPDASPDDVIDLPCYSYAVCDGKRTVIVDTGPDRDRAAAEGLEIVGNTTELFVSSLSALLIDPASVDFIVHTHLHHDHMWNDRLFPNAVVYVQETEVRWATGPDTGRFYFGVDELLGSLGGRLHMLDGDVELFPGLSVVVSAGHTPGHQSVIVDTPGGIVCICGDVVSLFDNQEVVGPICPDERQTEVFLRRARNAGWEMVPSHDPKLRAHRLYVQSRDTGVAPAQGLEVNCPGAAGGDF